MADYEIVDAQLHASPAPGAAPSAEELLAEMETIGVDAAVLVQRSIDGPDNSYVFAAAAEHPERFAAVGVLDPAATDPYEELVTWTPVPTIIGTRIVAFRGELKAQLQARGFDSHFSAARRAGLPVLVFAPGVLPTVGEIAGRFPEVTIVIDHFGLSSPPVLRADDPPFAALEQLLALAEHPNVVVKASGVPALSQRPFPFADIWAPLHSVVDAFGMDRVMWGTDATRVASMHSYEEAVAWLRDSDEFTPPEKAQLMGGNLRRIMQWPAHVS